MIGGLRVTISRHAVERIECWPVKKRSARLQKKLTKLRGPQFVEKPVAFKTPQGLVVHPDLYAQICDRKETKHEQ